MNLRNVLLLANGDSGDGSVLMKRRSRGAEPLGLASEIGSVIMLSPPK